MPIVFATKTKEGAVIWCTGKKYMIMDVTTGQYIKFGKNNKTVGEIEEVIKRVEGYGHKHALIVELSCITPTIL